jgi:excisionase family DNA binding protein
VDKHKPEKMAGTIRELSKRAGICVENIYEEIRQGRLKARKFGRRTLILEEDARSFLANLPALELPPREPRQRRSEGAR